MFFMLTRPKPSPRSCRALADVQDATRGVASESPTGTQVGEDERSRGGSCPEGRIPCVFAKGHVEGAVKGSNPLKDARILLRPDAADPPEAHAVPTRLGGVRRPRAPTPSPTSRTLQPWPGPSPSRLRATRGHLPLWDRRIKGSTASLSSEQSRELHRDTSRRGSLTPSRTEKGIRVTRPLPPPGPAQTFPLPRA